MRSCPLTYVIAVPYRWTNHPIEMAQSTSDFAKCFPPLIKSNRRLMPQRLWRLGWLGGFIIAKCKLSGQNSTVSHMCARFDKELLAESRASSSLVPLIMRVTLSRSLGHCYSPEMDYKRQLGFARLFFCMRGLSNAMLSVLRRLS